MYAIDRIFNYSDYNWDYLHDYDFDREIRDDHQKLKKRL